jgi:hypothetical protein
VIIFAALSALLADTYYVSPEGNDAHDGRTPAQAWKTVAKVNTAPLRPGDQVLFARGGEWREGLRPPASGAPGRAILFGAFGEGPKPKFWGSDILRNSEFKPAQEGAYPCPAPSRVASVLANHEFLPAGSWSWENGTLRIRALPKDPRLDGRVYTVCVRVDPVHSNGKNHLVLRDLVADESADERDGYGFRVMGSDDVRLENCEAYRAGRHHFGTINSSNFVGKGLRAAYAMPACPGGATFYVSFSDASRKGDRHQWSDCSGEHFEDGRGGSYQVFYDHGEGLGPILIENLTSRGGRLSIGSSKEAPITLRGGLVEGSSLEVFGDHAHADGLMIRGNGAVDVFGSDSLFENLIVAIAPEKGGPTGYGAGILLREGARRNTIRFSTVLLDGENAVRLLARGSETRLVGNVLISKGPGVAGAEETKDLALSDWNFYGGTDLGAWKARGFDPHGHSGDPKLGADYYPKPGSLLIGAVNVGPELRPERDQAGQKRPPACSIGAREPRP